MPNERISAVVVTFRSAADLPLTLPPLAAAVDELIIVDNASDDDTVEVARRVVPDAKICRLPTNKGFAAGVNAGFDMADGDAFLVVNPDCEVTTTALEALRAANLRHPDAVLGPVIRFPDGSLQRTRRGLPTLWNLLGEELLVPESTRPGRWPARLWPRWRSYAVEEAGPLLSAACLYVPRAVWERVGPMDERYFLYWEETDWQLRAHARGIPVILVPSASVVHRRAGSTGVHDPQRSRLFGASARDFVHCWLPGRQAKVAVVLIALGQLLRWVIRSLPGADRARRAQHAAMLRGFLGSGPRSLPGSPAEAHPEVRVVDPFGRGGISRYAVDLGRLLGPGVTVAIATTDSGPVPGWDGPVEVWFPSGRWGMPGKVTAGFFGLLRATRLRREDVVWEPLGVHPLFELLLAAIVRARGGRLVVTVHNRAPHDRAGTALGVWLAARISHRVVVHTAELEGWARSRRLPVRRLPFPIPQEQLDSWSGELERSALAPDGAVLVALLGNLYHYKGLDVLLDAVALAQMPQLRVVLMGQLEDGVDIEGRCQDLGIAEQVVLIPGYAPGGALVQLLDAVDAVVLPYRRIDHTGVGTLAASRRVPAIASDLPALRELFGDRALYVPPGEIPALADALRRLPALLADLREAAAPEIQADWSCYRELVAQLNSATR